MLFFFEQGQNRLTPTVAQTPIRKRHGQTACQEWNIERPLAAPRLRYMGPTCPAGLLRGDRGRNAVAPAAASGSRAPVRSLSPNARHFSRNHAIHVPSQPPRARARHSCHPRAAPARAFQTAAARTRGRPRTGCLDSQTRRQYQGQMVERSIAMMPDSFWNADSISVDRWNTRRRPRSNRGAVYGGRSRPNIRL
ncbi:hypothetical protein BC834DRAFT_133367 [Gloeopeniophorella convolvens]|nr:hypothetical protein BC834DRAFT_133367 [Gloeopeniophorella convolvens]